MLAIKAPAYVALIATLLLAVISLLSAFSAHQLSMTPWLVFAFSSLLNFMLIFLVGLLPMPAAVLGRRYMPTTHAVVRFTVSLAFGGLMVWLILRVIETPTYESDGVSSIYRHAGPTVNASTNILYYLSAAPILVLSLIAYHWLERANKSTQPT